jgi:uncharacterized protein (TIGR02117 family)
MINLHSLSFLFLLILCGCSEKPAIVKHSQKFSGSGHNEIYVVSHGWHTGFVVPSNTIFKSIPSLKQRFDNSPNIEIGWGDKEFYQAKKMTFGLTVRAIFWPTESVVHVVAVPQNVRGYFQHSEVELLCLNDNELSSLATFITNSFHKPDSGEIEALAHGIYGDSQFYKGAGKYHLMNGCNKWTAKGLKSIGMDISPTFKLTADSVMSYLSESKLLTRRPNRLGSGLQECPL